MKPKLLSSTLALAGALISLSAWAYNDTDTHPRITSIAVKKSALYTDPTLLPRLGLGPVSGLTFTYRMRFESLALRAAQDYDLADLMGEGAFDEDVGSRAVNHFFDPDKDRPLTVVGIALGQRSWEWVLEQTPNSAQARSIADGRKFLRDALINNEGSASQSEAARGQAIGNVFLCLSTAAHHLQDMSQPQHVRNDDHLDDYEFYGLNPFYKPSRYETYTLNNPLVVDAQASGAAAVYPGSADFKVAKDFWVNGNGSGAAQLTNKNFVSQGTNFTVSFFGNDVNVGTYPLPTPGLSHDYSPEELFGEPNVPPQVRALCADPAIPCTMTMYAAGPSPKASTLSIFDQDLNALGVSVSYPAGDITTGYETRRIFALNRFNFDDAHRVLIGQAAAYTAGFINHFFRGKLEIDAPETGPYAAVDQAAGQGFTTLRARVKNATPNEALSGGKLRAIARFHRNQCYQPDLSGEFQRDEGGQIVIPCPDYRSDEGHIRVTAEQDASFATDQTRELTFTFDDPIPLDATDLTLQVFYEGTVGSEPGAFALGAADISEPTFAAVMNGTDTFVLPTGAGAKFFYYKDIISPANITAPPYSVVDADKNGVYNSPPDVNVVGGDIAYEFVVDGRPVGNVTALPEGRFARLALLVKPSGFKLRVKAFGTGFNNDDTYSLSAKQAQFDYEQGTYFVSTMHKLRDQTLQNQSITYYRYYLASNANSDDMPPSKAEGALSPVAVVIGNALPDAPPGLNRAASPAEPFRVAKRQGFEEIHAVPTAHAVGPKAINLMVPDSR